MFIFADGVLRFRGVRSTELDRFVAAQHMDGCIIGHRSPTLGHGFGDAGRQEGLAQSSRPKEQQVGECAEKWWAYSAHKSRLASIFSRGESPRRLSRTSE